VESQQRPFRVRDEAFIALQLKIIDLQGLQVDKSYEKLVQISE
jgi:hypothetical protein